MENMFNMNEKIGNINGEVENYEKVPNGNFRTEKFTI